MTTDTSRLWETIDMDLCHDLDDAIGAGQYSGSLARSPLKKSSVAILGINWGGASPEWNHKPVSPTDDVIDDMGRLFARPLIRLLEAATGSTPVAHDILRNAFSTNRLLVQTANAQGDNRRLLESAAPGSSKALRRMLSVVQPRVVFCLGYGEENRYMSPSSFVLRDLAKLTGALWERPIAKDVWRLSTRRPSWVYYYSDVTLGLSTNTPDPLVSVDCITPVDVWCFAHPSARWAWSSDDGPWSIAQLVAALRSSLSMAGVLPPE